MELPLPSWPDSFTLNRFSFPASGYQPCALEQGDFLPTRRAGRIQRQLENFDVRPCASKMRLVTGAFFPILFCLARSGQLKSSFLLYSPQHKHWPGTIVQLLGLIPDLFPDLFIRIDQFKSGTAEQLDIRLRAFAAA